MWKFDQTRNTAAISDKYVVSGEKPILIVIHYKDDHSWEYLSGYCHNEKDAFVLSMEECCGIDNTIERVADIKPGYVARRKSINDEWKVTEESDQD